MKRRLGTILLVLFSVFHVQAQRLLDVPEVYVGVSGGATASMLMFSPNVAQSFQLGMNAGAAFRYIGNRNLGVQVELNYKQVGWQETETSTHDRMLEYLELPFLTHIYFGRKVRGFVNLGPRVAVLLNETKKNLPATLRPQHENIDNKFTYGLCAGLGMAVNTQKAGCYQLEARFSYDLANVFDDSKASYFGVSNTLALSLNLAWFFPMK